MPVNHFGDCTTVDANGQLIYTLVESGSAAFSNGNGPFADLDAEIVSIGPGQAGGIVESTVSLRVRRVNDLVAWVNVPVRYTYNVEAQVGAIGNNIWAGRMHAGISGFSSPSVIAEACTMLPSFGTGCDPNSDQSASRSGSGLLLLGEGAIATGFATAFGLVRSTHPTDPGQIGPNIQGTAVAEIRFEIDPNFAFASAFELEYSDGACIFGGDAGSFE